MTPVLFATSGLTSALKAQTIPDQVLDIFYDNCATVGCHAGPNAQSGLDLTEDFAAAGLVNKPSSDYGDEFLRVDPQNPARSYLIMKIKGDAKIKGDRMPRGGQELSDSEIAAIESWINSLPAEAQARAPEREYADTFPGITLSTLPTTQTLETGIFAYRIAHRWRGNVDGGFAQLFGLDAGARMLTQLTFAFTDNLNVTLARTSENATFEFAAKWRFLREKNDGTVPFSAALVAGLDWATRKQLTGVLEELDRTDSERFHWFGQVALSKKIGERISVLLVPGVLLNGNAQVEDEDALITIGFGAKFEIIPDFSVFIEGVPIVSGAETAEVLGVPRFEAGEQVFNDAFTLGLEKRVGGHVFHVYVTNSLGLSTNQYMSGGNFDFLEGDVRLGFNIYRRLRMPF